MIHIQTTTERLENSKRSIHRTSLVFPGRDSLRLKPTGFQGGEHGTEKQGRMARTA
jgi:hypothetical protein